MVSAAASPDNTRELLARLWERSLPVVRERLDILDEAATAAGIRGRLFTGGSLLDFVRTLAPPRRRIADYD